MSFTIKFDEAGAYRKAIGCYLRKSQWEHDNHIQNALGKRVNGFWGIEALVAPPVL